jgi:hypothetical protein
VQSRRRSKQLGLIADRPCGLCGATSAVITESRAVRQGLAWLNPAWDADAKLYELCPGCGAKRPLEQLLAS